jgi:hypothetical protein
MADTFRETAQELAPRGLFLRDATSQAYLEALGGAVADTTTLVREGVWARWARTAPDDALVLIGDTRQIEQAPGETKTAYRRRLTEAWEIHQARGTKTAYKNVLEPLGVDPTLVFVWNHYETGVGNWWSNVYVVVDMTLGDPWTVDLWDDGTWDDGGVWDFDGLLATQVTYIRRTIRKWKWAGAFPVAIWVWLSGDVWDAGDTWDSGVWADAGVALPILLGHVWDESELIYGEPPEKWDDGSTWEEAFLE